MRRLELIETLNRVSPTRAMHEGTGRYPPQQPGETAVGRWDPNPRKGGNVALFRKELRGLNRIVLRIGVFAYGFPALALALGFLLLLAGFNANNQPEIQTGEGLVVVGVLLQLLYLFSRRR